MVTPPTITRIILVILSLSINSLSGGIVLEFVIKVVWSWIINVVEASDGVAKPLVTVTSRAHLDSGELVVKVPGTEQLNLAAIIIIAQN